MTKTLRANLTEGSSRLSQAGIENPRLAAELFMRATLNLSRVDIHLDPERMLSADEQSQFLEMIELKLKREPLQFIIGETEWFGLKFKCDTRALIPRPETEIVTEKALELLRHISRPRVVDVGTGTGCIAIAIALHQPAAAVVATDLSGVALQLARENAAMHGVETRIVFHHGDLFSAIHGEDVFNLIISNPPYVRESEYASLMPEVRDYEPRSALVGGVDGLDVIRELILNSPKHLDADGYLVLEFGIDHDEPVRRLALDAGSFNVIETIIDYNQRQRGIVLQKRK